LAEALILDAEAVNALAHEGKRGVLKERARAILTVAHERQALVRVPVAVLAEVCRGPRFDAAVNLLLQDRGIRVCNLTRSTAQRAGALLSKARFDSAHAIDAFVAATALEFETSIIATGDSDDISRLVASEKRVKVFSLNAG
jgi:predicted nucleic acid-binding protein